MKNSPISFFQLSACTQAVPTSSAMSKLTISQRQTRMVKRLLHLPALLVYWWRQDQGGNKQPSSKHHKTAPSAFIQDWLGAKEEGSRHHGQETACTQCLCIISFIELCLKAIMFQPTSSVTVKFPSVLARSPLIPKQVLIITEN